MPIHLSIPNIWNWVGKFSLCFHFHLLSKSHPSLLVEFHFAIVAFTFGLEGDALVNKNLIVCTHRSSAIGFTYISFVSTVLSVFLHSVPDYVHVQQEFSRNTCCR